jgi:hypothetical protein
MGKYIANIDADSLRYSVGFACQHTIYHCAGETFDNKADAISFSTQIEEPIEEEIIADPIDHCLHSVKIKLNGILNACGVDKHQLFLSGSGNFRDKLYSEYKANRDRNHRPVHYDAITEYMLSTWDAKVVNGMEADDALGINQRDNTILCAIDKDLNMIPGKHYNWDKNLLYEVSEDDANLWFWCQMVMGDTVDNIKGIPGKGAKSAISLLENCHNHDTRCDVVYKAYKERFKDYDEEFAKNANLLWIRRKSQWEGEHPLIFNPTAEHVWYCTMPDDEE